MTSALARARYSARSCLGCAAVTSQCKLGSVSRTPKPAIRPCGTIHVPCTLLRPPMRFSASCSVTECMRVVWGAGGGDGCCDDAVPQRRAESRLRALLQNGQGTPPQGGISPYQCHVGGSGSSSVRPAAPGCVLSAASKRKPGFHMKLSRGADAPLTWRRPTSSRNASIVS